eukprot:EC095129.1.p1 GENE.EC095129.1~~EC095129.1.p1  ORF type:complete len:153 (+),score=3.06 EC095129.1:65-523(+)
MIFSSITWYCQVQLISDIAYYHFSPLFEHFGEEGLLLFQFLYICAFIPIKANVSIFFTFVLSYQQKLSFQFFVHLCFHTNKSYCFNFLYMCAFIPIKVIYIYERISFLTTNGGVCISSLNFFMYNFWSQIIVQFLLFYQDLQFLLIKQDFLL